MTPDQIAETVFKVGLAILGLFIILVGIVTVFGIGRKDK